MNKLFLKIPQLNKLKQRFILLKNTSILSIPSILGIILSIISIPIHLQINGKSDYGNYIFFHFIFSFGLLLSFGLNKIVTIELSKKKFQKEIIQQSLFFSSLIILIVMITNIFISNFYKDLHFFLIIGLGISLTILYIILEGVIQGLKSFKLLSVCNFLFYTVALNIPSICLLIFDINYLDLIKFSIIIKIISILIIFLFINKIFIHKSVKSFKLFDKVKIFSKWYFLHNTNIQIYDFLDKYLINIFIGPVALAIYSIPYQLAGKITIFSKSLSAVLLPEISSEKYNDSFNISLNIYTIFIPLGLLLLFPILENILKIWLQDQYSIQILQLTKIFLIVSWISGISHILIALFEGKKEIKFNTLLEIIFIFPFLSILLIILFGYKSLISVSLILLLKEFVLFIFRSRKLQIYIDSLIVMYINIVFVIFILFLDLYFDKYFYISYISLVIFNSIVFIIKLRK